MVVPLSIDQHQWPVAIDEQLLTSLSPAGSPKSPAENFVRTLHPAGKLELTQASFRRTTAPGDTWHRNIAANVYDGTIRYDGFPYPIYDIRGRLVSEDDQWKLDQFEGRNDSGRILCTGRWQAVRSGQIPLQLQFTSFAVPLEEELQNALPEDGRYVWDQLQPSGTIDDVRVELNRQDADSPVQITVHLREISASNKSSGRSLRHFSK